MCEHAAASATHAARAASVAGIRNEAREEVVSDTGMFSDPEVRG
jgi:hypothetical protein